MADRPIIFSAPMVRALLAGTKTQTRRIIAPKPYNAAGDVVDINRAPTASYLKGADGHWYFQFDHPRGGPLTAYRAHIRVGDRLWVREAWHAARSLDGTPPRDIPRDADIEHAATARSYAEIGLKGKLRPGMFMPRWASRLTLTVTDVRVERLKDIGAADAEAEGVKTWVAGLAADPKVSTADVEAMIARTGEGSLVAGYAALWDAINGAGAWKSNPWVAAYSFTVAHRNIDQGAQS